MQKEGQPIPSSSKEATKAEFASAVRGVKTLYMDSLFKPHLLSPEDNTWYNLAREHSLYTTKINEFSKSLKDLKTTKEAYNNSLPKKFSYLEDGWAGQLLSDIAYIRFTRRPGYLDDNIDTGRETKAMGEELGIEGGTENEAIQWVTFDQVFEGVLTGSLSLKAKTKESRR